MHEQFSRTEYLIGKDGISKLHNSRVIVFGIGGVGGYVVEALVRSGLGAIDLVDHDKVTLSNINRQIIATHQTVGKYKIDIAGFLSALDFMKNNPQYNPFTIEDFYFSPNLERSPFNEIKQYTCPVRGKVSD